MQSQGKLLRIFISENDRHEGEPLFEYIVQQAGHRKMAGITVMRGLEGFGAHHHLHTAKVLRISADLPLVIDIVDTAEKIEIFNTFLESVLEEGLVTVQDVEMSFFKKRKRPEIL